MTKISKFLLFFFVSLCLACLIASQVEAKTSTVYTSLAQARYTAGANNQVLNVYNNNWFNGVGEGNLIFTFTVTGKMNFQAFNVYTTNSAGWSCSLGTTTAYTDNNNQYVLYTATCPVNITDRLYKIESQFYCFETNSCIVDYGKFWSFSNFESSQDYSSVLNSIRANTQDTVTAIGNLRGDLQTLDSDVIDKFNQTILLLQGNNSTLVNSITQQTNQQHTDSQNTQQKIEDVSNTITNDNITGNNSSDSITGITSSFQSSNDWLLNIFTLPYTFITAIMNGISDSCTPISLGTIFDYELVMPCMNLNSILGNVWTTIVDVICAGVFAFAFRRRIHDFIFAIITLDRKAISLGGVDIL